MIDSFVAGVMAGGKASRFPVERDQLPKHFQLMRDGRQVVESALIGVFGLGVSKATVLVPEPLVDLYVPNLLEIGLRHGMQLSYLTTDWTSKQLYGDKLIHGSERLITERPVAITGDVPELEPNTMTITVAGDQPVLSATKQVALRNFSGHKVFTVAGIHHSYYQRVQENPRNYKYEVTYAVMARKRVLENHGFGDNLQRNMNVVLANINTPSDLRYADEFIERYLPDGGLVEVEINNTRRRLVE